MITSKFEMRIDALGFGEVLLDGVPQKDIFETIIHSRATGPTTVTLKRYGGVVFEGRDVMTEIHTVAPVGYRTKLGQRLAEWGFPFESL